MLIESEIKELASKKEYTKVFNDFHEDDTGMLRDFLERHEVEVKEKDCLIYHIVKTRVFMPKYNSYTISISNAIYNEDLSEETKYEMLMSSYKEVYKAFKT